MIDFWEVGIVKEIWRYPVKSMAGEQLAAAEVNWHGINGDRRAAFVRSDNHSGFPWLTGRQVPELNQYRPRYTNLADVINSDMVVDTPDGRTLPLDSPDLLAELATLYGREISQMRIKRGIFDSLTLSVMSAASALALAEAAHIPPDMRRWRQNIIIETTDGRAFAEEEWIGQSLVIGDVTIQLNQRIPRCVMVNVDPATAAKDAHVLKMVATQRDNCVGIHGTPQTTGTIRVGAVVKLMAGSRLTAPRREIGDWDDNV